MDPLKDTTRMDRSLIQGASSVIQANTELLRQASQEMDQTTKATVEFVQKVLVKALKSQNKAKQELLALETELRKQIVLLEEQLADLHMTSQKEQELADKALDVELRVLDQKYARALEERKKWKNWYQKRDAFNHNTLNQYGWRLYCEMERVMKKSKEDKKAMATYNVLKKNYSNELAKLLGKN